MFHPSTPSTSSAPTRPGLPPPPVILLTPTHDAVLDALKPMNERADRFAACVTPSKAPRGLAAERRFALLDVADDHGRVHGRDLLFRRDSMLPLTGDQDSITRVSSSLANALLDGYAANSLPVGELLVPMDEAALSSPIALALTPEIGGILLPPSLTVTTQVLMRVAQLRALGIRFSIDGVSGLDDPRWLLAPYVHSVRLHLDQIPTEILNALVARADAEGLEVIGCGVQSMTGYRRLEHLVVTKLQGPVIAAPLELIVPALPGCDEAVLRRMQLLQANQVSAQALSTALSADLALVMRLLVLHRLYVGRRQEEPVSLTALVKSLPRSVLSAWLEILRRTACHGHHVGWGRAVRDQVEVYQRSVLRHSDTQDREAVDASVWLFLRRLCSPTHYLKTLRHPG